MSPLTIKRKDSLVKAVRRNATRQLDAVIDSLTGPKPSPTSACRELLRLQSLLHLVRRPLAGEVFNREHRAVLRGLKALPDASVPLRETLVELAAVEPTVEVPALLDGIEPEQTPLRTPRKKSGPDPKLLRLVADLAEMRMRARYWHLPDGGFELLAPGLRQSYQRAATRRGPEASPAEFAAALGRFADQLQAVERVWPDMMITTRKAARRLQQHAQRQADLAALRPYIQDHADLLTRLDEQAEQAHAATLPLRDQLFVETPAAFTKRLGGWWDAWRV
ncbi:MAG: hypothetical protein AAF593_05955 [Planctomycetota bacterium]